ncbi:MAG: response regulator [Planctomycetes bacterium HGW-Planctomycetes-1]|nr:MAG: response regulator [Planctomycetes bacterium HGW-Planctomycetes-1]
MEKEQKRANVLLVEDEPGDQKLIETAILSNNSRVNLKIVSSGEEALDYLRASMENPEQCPKPSLILLDLNMPGMGGREFLKVVKADNELCSIPVVIVTTSDDEGDIKECYARHAAGYIQKSASPQEFNDTFKKLTRYWFSTFSYAG